MAITKLEEKAWYRVLQVLRFITYGLLILTAWFGSAGTPAYSVPNPTYGIPDYYPGTPFNWGTFFGVLIFGWLFIELARIGVIYIVAGKGAADEARNEVFGSSRKS